MDGTNFELVEDFMEAMGQDVNVVPTFPEEEIQRLRLDLIEEELDELEELEELVELVLEELEPVGGVGEADPPPPPPPQACRRKITNRKLKYFINLIKNLHLQYGFLHL